EGRRDRGRGQVRNGQARPRQDGQHRLPHPHERQGGRLLGGHGADRSARQAGLRRRRRDRRGDRPGRHLQPHELGGRRQLEEAPSQDAFLLQPCVLRNHQRRRERPAGGRRLKRPTEPVTLVAAVVGGVAGAVVFAALTGFGSLLSSRVGSPIPLIALAIAGAYAGWLLGVIVFGAVRGGNDETTP